MMLRKMKEKNQKHRITDSPYRWFWGEKVIFKEKVFKQKAENYPLRKQDA